MRNIIKFDNSIDRDYFKILFGFYRSRKISKAMFESIMHDILKNMYPTLKITTIINEYEVNTTVKNYGILVSPSISPKDLCDAVFSIDDALIDALSDDVLDCYFFTVAEKIPEILDLMESFIKNKTVRVDLADVVDLYTKIYLEVVEAVETNEMLFNAISAEFKPAAVTFEEIVDRINTSINDGTNLESRIQLFMTTGAFPIFIIRKIQLAYKEFNEIKDEESDLFAGKIAVAINKYTNLLNSLCTTKDEKFYKKYAGPLGKVIISEKDNLKEEISVEDKVDELNSEILDLSKKLDNANSEDAKEIKDKIDDKSDEVKDIIDDACEDKCEQCNEDLVFDYTPTDVAVLEDLVAKEEDPAKKKYLEDCLNKAKFEVAATEFASMSEGRLPSDGSNPEFGIPEEKKYPLFDKKHVESAIKLFGHVEPKYESKLAKAIISKMRKYGINKDMVGEDNKLYKYLNEDVYIYTDENIATEFFLEGFNFNADKKIDKAAEYAVMGSSIVQKEIKKSISVGGAFGGAIGGAAAGYNAYIKARNNHKSEIEKSANDLKNNSAIKSILRDINDAAKTKDKKKYKSAIKQFKIRLKSLQKNLKASLNEGVSLTPPPNLKMD